MCAVMKQIAFFALSMAVSLFARADGAPSAGISRPFAVCERLGTRSDAVLERVREILGDTLDGARLSVSSEPLVRSEVAVTRSLEGSSVRLPFERSLLVFVDDRPGANWAHPCRYVFLDEGLAEFAVSNELFPPNVRRVATGEPVAFETVGGGAERTSLELVVNGVRSYAKEMAAGPKGTLANADRSHFVLISGGGDPANNGIRFWADTAMLYSTLTLKYGIRKDRIHVLMSDGTSDGKDANLGDYYNPVLVSSPTDLDGDGEADVDGAATIQEWFNVFTNVLPSTVTKDDQVMVFLTSHGSAIGNPGPANRNSCAFLFSMNSGGADSFRDSTLAANTRNLPCPVAFVIETCYAGGFIDDLTGVPNRVVATACDHYEESYGYGGDGAWKGSGPGCTCAYDCWAMPFVAAVRGCYPRAHDWDYCGFPWQDGSPCDADSDGDGKVTFAEAAAFAAAEDVAACPYARHGDSCHAKFEHPQYAESTAGLGAKLFSFEQSEVVIGDDGGEILVPRAWFKTGRVGDRQLFDPADFAKRYGTDFAKAAAMKTGKRDASGRELSVWHDFVAGTDPTDEASVFRTVISFENGCLTVTHDPDLGEWRTYRLFGLEDLSRYGDPSAWREVGRGEESAFRFFRATVEPK